WWRLALARRSGRALTPVNGYEFDRGAQALQITDEDFIEVLQQFIEFGPTTSLGGEGVRAGLLEGHSRVKLAAALAMRAHPDRAYMEPLLRTLENCDAHDETLRHALKLAVREHCRDGELFKLAADSGPRSLIVEVATALPTSEAAEFLLHDLESDRSSGEATRLHHIARYGRPETITQLVAIASERAPEDVQVLAAIYGGLQESGVVYPKELLAWATQAAEGLLGLEVANRHQWTFLGDGENPFCLQERKCADGKSVSVISSLNHDLKGPEKLTGILRSAAFSAPERLSFWLCGHQGFPNEPANEKNFVRLVDQKGALLQKALPPRDDVCQRIEWDLSAIQGKQVRMEIVDGDDGRSYAWLGVTRIEPAVVDVATFDSDATRQKNLRTLAGILQYTAPATLRERLAAYLPPRPAPPPLPVSAEQRQQLDALIQARAKAFASANPDTQMGKVLFTNNCAICHQIGGAGGLIGPQLDGIKNRGVDRLCEDILDPNRNVDAHFHLHVIKMKDGNAAAGFLRGEYGQVVELVDTAGQSHRVSKGDIVEEQITPMSVMPPTFGQTLDEKNFVDLVGWLMTQ
ncbi:MAG: c-type cytochrome, partial [Verrucomicrobiales bacterium]|nr:c-type cytochrome [Verrucomicrobiales bacterium]